MRPTLPSPRRGAAASTAVVAGIAVLASAGAATARDVSFTFEGRGFGHGVGMSQYGARGAALKGWDARRILGWYYRGASLDARAPVTVRVLLTDGVSSVQIGSTGAGAAVVGDERVALGDGAVYTARAGGPGVQLLRSDGAVVAQGAAGVRVAPSGALVRVGGRRYRGVVDVVPAGGALRVVNALDSEGYVQGVLPGEMPSSWGDDTPAALQAQAVAARTYALASLSPSRSFDLYDDTRSQMYVGVDGEDRRANAAVAATRGQVLTYAGGLITAYYSSTSGGHTENVENAFGGSPRPYLRGVPDPYDDVSPLHRWPSPPTFTATQLGSRLRVGAPVADVQVLARGVSPRVLTARVVTADGRAVTLTGASIKARLDLPDTWFWVRRSDRTAPAEPPVAGGSGGAPVSAPVPSRPTRAVTLLIRRGRWMAVAARTRTRVGAARIDNRLRRARPHAVVVRRTTRGRAVYLVVTGRYPTQRSARAERAALRRLGYPAAVVLAARPGDPAIRPPRVVPRVASGTPQTPAAPSVAVPRAPRTPPPAPTAPAPGTYTVVAAEVEFLADATAAVERLGAGGRRPKVVSRWTQATGTRYLVVTLVGVPLARARAERDALVALGYPGARAARD